MYKVKERPDGALVEKRQVEELLRECETSQVILHSVVPNQNRLYQTILTTDMAIIEEGGYELLVHKGSNAIVMALADRNIPTNEWNDNFWFLDKDKAEAYLVSSASRYR